MYICTYLLWRQATHIDLEINAGLQWNVIANSVESALGYCGLENNFTLKIRKYVNSETHAQYE